MARTILALVAATVGLSGCIGATDRSDFDAEVRARGGGVTSDWIVGAFDSAAISVGGSSADDLVLLSFTVSPPDRTASIVTRRVDRPDFVDVVVVRQGEVVSSTPIQDADDLPLDDITIPFGDLPLDRVEELTDRALAEFGADDGFVDAIVLENDVGGARINVRMESARQTAEVVFGTDGAFQEVVR